MRERLIGLLGDPNDPSVEGKWLLDRGSFDDWFNDLDWLASQDLSESIGVVLTDEDEAKAVAAVRERVNAIFEDLGDVGFEAYRSDPRWKRVQEAARQAVAVIEPER
jgi:hypothetical protein